MLAAPPSEVLRHPPLRLWPGVTAVVLQWLVRWGVPTIVPEAAMYAVIGGLAGGLAVLAWWVLFSRAPRAERWGAVAMIAVGLAATPRFLHESVATGMMGMMFPLYATPVLSLALVAWALAARRLSGGLRHAALAAAIFGACGGFALVRTDGIYGEGHSQFAWRWRETHEERLLARAPSEPPLAAPLTLPAAPEAKALPPSPPKRAPAAARLPVSPAAEEAGPEWPGFRGPRRDGVVRDSRIRTDWAVSPPVEVWRRPVGPGWSSFAVQGGLVYTQEQRGDFEAVACYRLATGEPVWTHRDPARFWESNGGAGPRSTPALYEGRVYSFGATGILNALDARTGALIWTRNASADTGVEIPGWGFTSSPLIARNSVIIAVSGRLAAYGLARGEPLWDVRTGGGSYSSPHWLTIGGVAQVALLSGAGVTSVDPANGQVLWKHAWEGATILQPALTADGGVLITTSDMSGGVGTRRLAVARGPAGWTVGEQWTSRGLKPYFNDLAVHQGHAYGFDGSILSCIGLADGSRKWKGGRYGHGQLILLAGQDLLLVLSEDGEVALVRASADEYAEIARFRAIEGKTWNHPVLVGSLLLVRNGQEMALFRLPLARD